MWPSNSAWAATNRTPRQGVAHRYGDWKDKATLVSSMLRELGIDSYEVVIYTERGAVTPKRRPIRDSITQFLRSNFRRVWPIHPSSLPLSIPSSASFFSRSDQRPNTFASFPATSRLIRVLKCRWWQLVELPQQASSMNSIGPTAKASRLSRQLKGDVEEVRLGERASSERWGYAP